MIQFALSVKAEQKELNNALSSLMMDITWHIVPMWKVCCG